MSDDDGLGLPDGPTLLDVLGPPEVCVLRFSEGILEEAKLGEMLGSLRGGELRLSEGETLWTSDREFEGTALGDQDELELGAELNVGFAVGALLG